MDKKVNEILQNMDYVDAEIIKHQLQMQKAEIEKLENELEKARAEVSTLNEEIAKLYREQRILSLQRKIDEKT